MANTNQTVAREYINKLAKIIHEGMNNLHLLDGALIAEFDDVHRSGQDVEAFDAVVDRLAADAPKEIRAKIDEYRRWSAGKRAAAMRTRKRAKTGVQKMRLKKRRLINRRNRPKIRMAQRRYVRKFGRLFQENYAVLESNSSEMMTLLHDVLEMQGADISLIQTDDGYELHLPEEIAEEALSWANSDDTNDDVDVDLVEASRNRGKKKRKAVEKKCAPEDMSDESKDDEDDSDDGDDDDTDEATKLDWSDWKQEYEDSCESGQSLSLSELKRLWNRGVSPADAAEQNDAKTDAQDDEGDDEEDYDEAASGPADSVEARELEIFIQNDSDLYRQKFTPIVKNLMLKRKKGKYDNELAVKLFMYLVDDGAKKYRKAHGGGEFNKNTRLEVAKSLRDTFKEEADLGNYDKMVGESADIKAKKQTPKKGPNGGYLSVVYYEIAKGSGYSITGKTEWKNVEDANKEADKRIARAKETGVAESDESSDSVFDEDD